MLGLSWVVTNSTHAAKNLQYLANKNSDDKMMHEVNKIRKMLRNEFMVQE